MKVSCSTLLLAIATIGVPGCSENLNTVEGTVTFDNAPLKGATVTFSPAEGGRPSSAQTDDDGHYELEYTREKSGARIGKYIVRITTATTDDDGDPIDEKLPDQYHTNADQNPEMTKEVQKGSNTFDFKLESKGTVTQPKDQNKRSRGDGDTCG